MGERRITHQNLYANEPEHDGFEEFPPEIGFVYILEDSNQGYEGGRTLRLLRNSTMSSAVLLRIVPADNTSMSQNASAMALPEQQRLNHKISGAADRMYYRTHCDPSQRLNFGHAVGVLRAPRSGYTVISPSTNPSVVSYISTRMKSRPFPSLSAI